VSLLFTDEVLNAVLSSDESDEKKSGQENSAVVDQYKQIIREQVNDVHITGHLSRKAIL